MKKTLFITLKQRGLLGSFTRMCPPFSRNSRRNVHGNYTARFRSPPANPLRLHRGNLRVTPNFARNPYAGGFLVEFTETAAVRARPRFIIIACGANIVVSKGPRGRDRRTSALLVLLIITRDGRRNGVCYARLNERQGRNRLLVRPVVRTILRGRRSAVVERDGFS